MTPVELFIIGFAILLVGFGILFAITRKSYRNEVDIARQTGHDPSDVIWIHDKYRVINKDGAWTIEFAKLKEKTRSIDGKFWTKFLKPGSTNKLVSYDKDKWNSMDMSTHIKRGLKLYETTEGEFYPMTIKKVDSADGKSSFQFGVLDQDNRQFIINETQGVNDLTRNKKQEVALLWGIVIGFVVLGVTFMVFMYFLNKGYVKNLEGMAQICGQIYQGYINTPQNVTASNNYLQSLTKTLGG